MWLAFGLGSSGRVGGGLFCCHVRLELRLCLGIDPLTRIFVTVGGREWRFRYRELRCEVGGFWGRRCGKFCSSNSSSLSVSRFGLAG